MKVWPCISFFPSYTKSKWTKSNLGFFSHTFLFPGLTSFFELTVIYFLQNHLCTPLKREFSEFSVCWNVNTQDFGSRQWLTWHISKMIYWDCISFTREISDYRNTACMQLFFFPILAPNYLLILIYSFTNGHYWQNNAKRSYIGLQYLSCACVLAKRWRGYFVFLESLLIFIKMRPWSIS